MLPVMFCVAPEMVMFAVVKHLGPRLPGSGYAVPGAEQTRNFQNVLPGVMEPLAMRLRVKLPFESQVVAEVGGNKNPPVAVTPGGVPPPKLWTWGRRGGVSHWGPWG